MGLQNIKTHKIVEENLKIMVKKYSKKYQSQNQQAGQN